MVVFLFSLTGSNFTAANVGVLVNQRKPDVFGVVFLRFGLFVVVLILSGGFFFDDKTFWNKG